MIYAFKEEYDNAKENEKKRPALWMRELCIFKV